MIDGQIVIDFTVVRYLSIVASIVALGLVLAYHFFAMEEADVKDK